MKKENLYLKFYIGQQYVLEIVDKPGHYTKKQFFGSSAYSDSQTKWKDDYILYPILVLRTISDITDDEKKDIYHIIFKKQFPPSGNIIWRSDKSITTDPRWMLLSGVDRVGIEMNGTVWADCDLHTYKYNQHFITAFLISKGFDLFGLLESKLAIQDKDIPK